MSHRAWLTLFVVCLVTVAITVTLHAWVSHPMCPPSDGR